MTDMQLVNAVCRIAELARAQQRLYAKVGRASMPRGALDW
jgi:hypothetical protein